MNITTIPLKAVRAALLCAKVRRTGHKADGKPIVRFAAYSQYPDQFFTADCGHKRAPALTANPPYHFALMTRGNLAQLLQRVHCSRPGDVRRTWGAGVKALKVEFAEGALR